MKWCGILLAVSVYLQISNLPRAQCQADYLVFANRQRIQRLEFGSYTLRTLYTDSTRNFVAFDYDYRRSLQYWTDVTSGPVGSIYKSNLAGGEVTTVLSGSLDLPDGLAIDWLTNKLYWSEATPETISVLDLQRNHRLTLFTLPQSSIPRGIALDPVNGYMFWTDWGSPGKIERAYMDGTGRMTLANTNLVWPNDITIDHESQTLYWVDAGLDKVETAAYDGSNRRILVTSGRGVYHPFSITFFNNTLYWTDWQDDVVTAKSLASDTFSIVYSGLSTEPMGIEAVSLSRQPIVSTPCDSNNGNCEQLCLLSFNRTSMCACVDGYSLASDRRSCVIADFIGFANRWYIQKLNPSTFTLQTLYTDTTENFIAFGYDFRRNYLYWTDTALTPTSSIYRSNLQGGDFHVVISMTLDVPDGLAVDWLTNKLYWTEATPETISVLDLERGHRLTLFSLPESSIPRGIALDPARGYMFWTDWGSPGKVERAYMDGSGRMTLADTGLVWPNDVTVDFASQTLYWVEASLDNVESCGYDGSNRRTLVSSGVFHPFSITLYENTLYWTDWQANAVYSLALGSSTPTIVYNGLVTDPMGIEAITPDRQEMVSTPCDTDNGNCNQLCLLGASRTATCACVDGYTLAMDGRTCNQVQDYLVFANRRYIQRLELDSLNLRTLYIDTTQNFIAFDYDYRRGYQYWTHVSGSAGSIYRSNLDGGRVTTVISESLQVPDGLAIDWLTNKLYWSEATPETISVLDLQRNHRHTLFSLPESSIPRGIALDPVNSYMFWTDWGSPGKIERAYMDGTGRTTIADTSLVWPNDITIDFESQTLYWVDASLDKIESAAYDGSNRQTVATSGVRHPFSITFFQNTLYWTDWTTDAVHSKATGSSTINTAYDRLSTEPMGIEAVSTSRQTQASTGCDTNNGGCEHLCLLGPSRAATCRCAQGYTLNSDGRNCDPISTEAPVTTPTPAPVGSCRTAGFSDCCLGGDCLGSPRDCQCDPSCVILDDCCNDFSEICSAYTCATLPAISNGAITYSRSTTSRYPLETTANYTCNAGFYLSGSSTRTCTRSGTMGVWDGTAPQCSAITCSSLPAVTNGVLIYSPDNTAPFDFRTTATYSCTIGFGISSGDRTRQCVSYSSSGGGWSGTAPTCGTIICPNLPALSNGQVTYSTGSPYAYGTRATYSCSEGYSLSGVLMRTCGGDGSSTTGVWNGAQSVCLAITCPALPNPINGIVTFSPSSSAPYSFGTMASYSCVSGFGLSGGNAARTCGGDGSSPNGIWSGDSSNCRAITCNPLSPVNNGLIVYSPDVTSPYNYDTTATFNCNEGFFLEGVSSLTCEGDGLSESGAWSGSAPVCSAVRCLALVPPENGVITYSEGPSLSLGFMVTATYSCNTGFGLSSGDNVRTCTGGGRTSGTWTAAAPTCRAISCTSVSPPVRGYVSFSATPHIFGTVASFSCATGYGLRGETTRTCGGDGSSTSGMWSGVTPSCVAYTCTALPSITNGMISYSPDGTSSFNYGATATYSCNAGFYLSTAGLRRCSGSGTTGFWDGTEPECLAIMCTSLGTPTNGLISYGPDTTSPYNYQTVATYSCNTGYGLFGDDTSRQCVSSTPGDAGWNGAAPTCETITCSVLTPLTNGRVTFSSTPPYTFGTSVTYSCNDGFGLSRGDTTRTCGGDGSSPNGVWNGVVPTCEAITCSGLASPTNAMITFSPSSSAPYSFGTMASYSCVSGFGLSGGDATRTCGGDGSSPTGVWTGVVPSCGAITCTSLSSVNNGVISYSPDTTSPFDFSTTATYSCNEGFFLTGNNGRTCGGDGSSVSGVWTGSAPVCAAVMCPVLSDPANGVITYSEVPDSSVGFMETATYSCNTGFGLSSGDIVRTCVGAAGSSGEWTGTAPTCQAITCQSLSALSNGQVSLSGDTTSPYDYQTLATFSCNPGYGLSGSTVRTCGGDGSSPSGVWSGEPASCNPYLCNSLPLPANGMILYDPDTTSPYVFGTTASYICNEGYYLSQTSVRTCTGSGSASFWDGEEPQCIVVVCTTLANPTNGVISYGPDSTSPYDYQTTATYTCNEGYGLIGGDRTRQCDTAGGNVGLWDRTAPRCERITCPLRSPPINGQVDFSTDSLLTHGAMATYSCDEGYGLTGGDAVIMCAGDGSDPFGSWNGVVPTCEAITCSQLSSIANGDITYHGPDTTSPFSFGTAAIYTCNEGFALQGDNARTCSGDGSGVDGVWSSSAPVCIAFLCPKLSAPENGIVTSSTNAVGFVKRADYDCVPGFRISGGDTMRTCVSASGSSGEWTGTAPICELQEVVTNVSEQTVIGAGVGGGIAVIVVLGILVIVVVAVFIYCKRPNGKDNFRPKELYDDDMDNNFVYENVNANRADLAGAVNNPLYEHHEYENVNGNPVYNVDIGAALIDD